MADVDGGTVGPVVGRVIGTEDSTPLDFWVAVDPEQYLQLDDVVACGRNLPGGDVVKIYGVVSQVRARMDGVKYDSDVFLVADGTYPADVSESAQILATRFEPETYVPPLPGQPVRRAEGDERDTALFFDGMQRKLAAGLSRDGQPIHLNLDFLDGTRGAHVNISGVSGVATKTSYATFLLYSLFNSGSLGAEAANTKALIFNVKGEDLLFLDHENSELDDVQRDRYRQLGLVPGAFTSVAFFAPPRRDDLSGAADTGSRSRGVTSFFWTIQDFCELELMQFLFADAGDERQQYTMVVHNVMAMLKSEARPTGGGAITLEGRRITVLADLIDAIKERVESDDIAVRDRWAGRSIGSGTISAFIRRLYGAQRHVSHLIRGDLDHADQHKVDLGGHQVTVVDLHNLNDRAQRFVVGVLLRRTFDEKERSGNPRPLTFVVLDELNKYAPRDGSSPIKEVLLDIAERGRSLGIILVGAQQTASEVERRIVANSAIRVVGRLDSAEASREEYGFLPKAQRQRATIIKPGTMLLSQPELPVPLVLEFPFPAWATRPSEAGAGPAHTGPGPKPPEDPFSGFSDDTGDPLPF